MSELTLVVTPKANPKRLLLKRLGVAVGIFFLFLLLLLWYMGVFGGNVRVVEAGRVYRSAQITGEHLDTVLEGKKIRTLLNLKGGSSSDARYQSELESCKKYSVTHIDAPFSAVRMPPPLILQQILQVFDKAEYPILFHCRGGADRSGLTGVLYLHLYKNVPLNEAQNRQLTWHYGHIAWGQAHAMDDFLALYRKTANGLGLREWIGSRYPALYDQLPAEQRAPASDVVPSLSPPKTSRLKYDTQILAFSLRS